MRREDLSPAAVVRQQSNLRILKQEAVAISKRIDGQDRSRLVEYRELGLRLLPIRAAMGESEWAQTYKEMGISSQRVSEAITVAEYWSVVPARGSKRDFLKAKKENLLIQDSDAAKPPEIQATQETTEQDAAQNGSEQPSSSGPSGHDEATAPETPDPSSEVPDIGDAAEELPAGTITDPEGHALPPAVQEAFAQAAVIEAVVAELRALVGRMRKLADLPGHAGAFLPIGVVEKLARSGWRMLDNHIMRPGTTYRCDGYEQHGCAGAGCSKCKGLGVVPRPLYGETSKPKPRQPWRGRRR